MERGIFKLESMITHRFSLADCNRAFELARQGGEFRVKILFVNSGVPKN
jgi:Zn-dependent alcohol dehydrogenase